MINRAKKLVKNTILLFIGGLAYAGLLAVIGKGIPCLIRLRTGLFCPSCGVSRMCISILKLDLYSAYLYNRCLFCLIPVFLPIIIYNIYKYIKTGKTKPGRFLQFVYILIIIILIAFGIIRNIPCFSYLQPPTA